MEHLFSPCTRYRDLLLGNRRRLEPFKGQHPEFLQELDLDVSTEELLSAERAFGYADLYTMKVNTVIWLTPHAAVVREHGSEYGRVVGSCMQLDGSRCIRFTANRRNIIALARSSEALSEICDIVLRLLARSVVHSVSLSSRSSAYLDKSINAPTLAYLMERCQGLKFLLLESLDMDEDHCRALDTFSRPGFEIVLCGCKITSAGAIALAEVLGRNQGPTNLNCCSIDNYILADGLRGNSRLKSLQLRLSGDRDIGNREVIAIADALRENKGLIELRLSYYGFEVTDETWGAVCDSLETHPTLEVLDLRGTTRDDTTAPAVLKSQMQVLVDMMKVNTSIHTIHLDLCDLCYSEQELYRGSVIPYLETNRLRPRLLAIQKVLPIEYRAKVLGRALLAVQTDTNRFWMLLSGNAEVAFP